MLLQLFLTFLQTLISQIVSVCFIFQTIILQTVSLSCKLYCVIFFAIVGLELWPHRLWCKCGHEELPLNPNSFQQPLL